MIATHENEIGITSRKPESSRDVIPPEQQIAVFYRNGTGEVVEEVVTEGSFGDSGVIDKIRKSAEESYGEDLKELNIISKREKRLSGNRKHGGRPIPRRELPQRQKELARLAEKKSVIREMIARKKSLVPVIGNYLKASNPLNPLHLKVNAFTNYIEIIKGVPMEEGDQKWWEFIRREAPEIWGLHQASRKEDYEIIHTLFLGRFKLREAKRGPLKKEKAAQAELDEVLAKISQISDKRYVRIHPIVVKVTGHFPE